MGLLGLGEKKKAPERLGFLRKSVVMKGLGDCWIYQPAVLVFNTGSILMLFISQRSYY